MSSEDTPNEGTLVKTSSSSSYKTRCIVDSFSDLRQLKPNETNSEHYKAFRAIIDISNDNQVDSTDFSSSRYPERFGGFKKLTYARTKYQNNGNRLG